MKPKDRIQHLRSHLGSLALAAAIGAGATTPARAELVGRWFTGTESLADASGFTTDGIHDGVAFGGNAGSLAYSTDVPPGFTGKSVDLSAGDVAVRVSNSATGDAGYLNTFDEGVSGQLTVAFWAKGFPNNWSPWVGKRGENEIGWQVRRFDSSNGPCFTIRGLDNQDGGGTSIPVNNPVKWRHFAAVWDQSTGTRTVYVDGAVSHTVSNSLDDVMALAPAHSLVLGGRVSGGNTIENPFAGQLFDVRIYNNALDQQGVFNLIPQLAPAGLVATSGTTKVHLDWTPNTGAAEYRVSTKNLNTNATVTDVVTEPPFEKVGLSNGVPYEFKVLAINGAGEGPYSAVVNATPNPGTAKDILHFELDGFGPAQITGTNIVKYVPSGTDLSIITANYRISPFAREDENFPSGSFRDFTSAVTYTIKAENNSTKVYNVSVLEAAPITYTFDSDAQGWRQIWPLAQNGNLWENGGLGTPEGQTADGASTRFGRSPAFYLNNSGALTFQLGGGAGNQDFPNLGPSAIPAESIDGGGFAGVALRDVASNTYLLAKRRLGENAPSLQSGSFTEAELAPYANDGKRYTIDFIDYNKGGWGWTRLDNLSIPGSIAPPEEDLPEAKILQFTLSNPSSIATSGTNITMTLPFGTNVTSLAPEFVLSPGATSNKLSGSAQNFTGTVEYTITSSDSAVIQVYSVSAVVMPDPALALVGHWGSGAESLADTSDYTIDGTHDGVAVGSNAGLFAYSSDVPPGFTGKSLDLTAGGAGSIGISINNSANTDGGYLNTFDEQIRSQVTISFWAKGIPGTWNPWVAKGGEGNVGYQVRRVDADPVAGFTIRGLNNDDGRGSQINILNGQPAWHHYAAVWDQTTGVRSLYIDGVLSHDVTTAGQIMTLASGRHLTLGTRQNDVNGGYDFFFPGLLYDVRIYKQKLFINQIQALGASALFSTWINTNYPGLSDKTPAGDPDGDGLDNFHEFAFGLNPGSGSSVNSITVQPDKTTGIFQYTRLSPAASGLIYKVMTSGDLAEWEEDVAATASQTVTGTSGGVQTVTVTLSPALPGETKLFVRVIAQ